MNGRGFVETQERQRAGKVAAIAIQETTAHPSSRRLLSSVRWVRVRGSSKTLSDLSGRCKVKVDGSTPQVRFDGCTVLKVTYFILRSKETKLVSVVVCQTRLGSEKEGTEERD